MLRDANKRSIIFLPDSPHPTTGFKTLHSTTSQP
jgi:uncharacterized membrane protein